MEINLRLRQLLSIKYSTWQQEILTLIGDYLTFAMLISASFKYSSEVNYIYIQYFNYICLQTYDYKLRLTLLSISISTIRI
jgi:hypothetical protein